MKTVIVLIFLGFLGVTILEFMPAEELATTYCRKKAQEETKRVYNSGLRVRDRVTETENFDTCMEGFGKQPMLGDVLIRYFEPRDKAAGVLE